MDLNSVDYNNLFKLEILFKVLSKFFGLSKSLLVLFIFSFSGALDSHFYAFSLVGIILSISVVVELLFLQDLKRYYEQKKYSAISNLFYKLIFITIISTLLMGTILSIFQDVDIFQHIAILLIWSIFFVINSFFIILFRLNHQYKIIGIYFLLFPIFVMLSILLGHYILDYKSSLVVSISILVSEIILFCFLFLKLPSKNLLIFENSYLKLQYNKITIIKLLQSFSLISAVYLIDITDKFFAYRLGAGFTTILVYGMLAPLIIRQALDIKSVFYHKLQYSSSVNEDIAVFIKTLKWLSYILVPGIILFFTSSFFINYSLLNKFMDINQNQFDELVGVFLIYILILPIYIIWDMLYRIYYKNNLLSKLLFIISFGVLLNIVLNYVFITYFQMNTMGIALSTLIVLVSYCIYGYGFLHLKKQSNYDQESIHRQ